MEDGLKPSIVLSGVNFTDMGPLTVFREAIASLAELHSDNYKIIALVHRKSLFDIPGVKFIEYPEIKYSWFKRLRFEYYECRRISEEIKPYLWLAMHDMTPNVSAKIRAVYCHNPSPFYRFHVKEALLDWKFGLFTLLYRFLYGINIRSNDFVVVQQSWLRSEFQSRYDTQTVVVAHPSLENLSITPKEGPEIYPHSPYVFFYPAYPRTFKNMDQILNAARMLEQSGFRGFEIWLTLSGTETAYASKLRRDYGELSSVRWLGLLPHAEVLRRYAEADCLLFPSKLETWGIPITEFKTTGKPILAADLPYAHETVGTYDQVAFFDTESTEALEGAMRKAVLGESAFRSVEEKPIAPPFSQSWEELWNILLHPAR